MSAPSSPPPPARDTRPALRRLPQPTTHDAASARDDATDGDDETNKHRDTIPHTTHFCSREPAPTTTNQEDRNDQQTNSNPTNELTEKKYAGNCRNYAPLAMPKGLAELERVGALLESEKELLLQARRRVSVGSKSCVCCRRRATVFDVARTHGGHRAFSRSLFLGGVTRAPDGGVLRQTRRQTARRDDDVRPEGRPRSIISPPPRRIIARRPSPRRRRCRRDGGGGRRADIQRDGTEPYHLTEHTPPPPSLRRRIVTRHHHLSPCRGRLRRTSFRALSPS